MLPPTPVDLMDAASREPSGLKSSVEPIGPRESRAVSLFVHRMRPLIEVDHARSFLRAQAGRDALSTFVEGQRGERRAVDSRRERRPTGLSVGNWISRCSSTEAAQRRFESGVNARAQYG